ncbi:MAG: Crp/Fnr family transcriptional regulator [Saprospiraceae bacterium]|nr:Crp/Fnr family transcriptional regulator [Saprospiraceae bacterium]
MTATPKIPNNNYALQLNLSKDTLAQIYNEGELTFKTKGEHIFCQGDECDFWYYLVEGVVKITHESEFGKGVIKNIIHGEYIISDIDFDTNSTHQNSATVVSDQAKYLKIKIELLHNFIKSNPNFALRLVEFLSARLKMSEKRLESLALDDARERIVGFLKDNAEAFGTPVGFEMLLRHNFTQQDIASYTGTSRQTVTMVLNDLKKTNKINFRRKSILIRDLKALC